MKFISIIGPSWCLIRSGVIPEPNGEESKPITTLPFKSFPVLTEGPTWAQQDGAPVTKQKKRCKKRRVGGETTKMLKKRKAGNSIFSFNMCKFKLCEEFRAACQVKLLTTCLSKELC